MHTHRDTHVLIHRHTLTPTGPQADTHAPPVPRGPPGPACPVLHLDSCRVPGEASLMTDPWEGRWRWDPEATRSPHLLQPRGRHLGAVLTACVRPAHRANEGTGQGLCKTAPRRDPHQLPADPSHRSPAPMGPLVLPSDPPSRAPVVTTAAESEDSPSARGSGPFTDCPQGHGNNPEYDPTALLAAEHLDQMIGYVTNSIIEPP